MSKLLLIIPVVLGPTIFHDLHQCSQINKYNLIDIESELFFVTVPALLTVIAVAVVSVYTLKLQIRLSREIQPQVNLPTENAIPTQPREDIEMNNIGTSNEAALGEPCQRPSWDDIQIVDLEDSEEIATLERTTITKNKNVLEEEKESSFSVSRKNSDPNHFFRVPKETAALPAENKDCSGCLIPLSLVAERILMINIPALCISIDLVMAASMRLYFVIKDKEKEGVLLMSYFHYLIVLTYVLQIRKRLCK